MSPMAATTTPSSSRRGLYRPRRRSAPRIIELSGKVGSWCSEKFEPMHPLDPRSAASATSCGPTAARATGGRAQRRLLWRAGDRPKPCGTGTSARTGASVGQGAAEGRRTIRPRKLYRQPLHRQGRADENRGAKGHHPVNRGIGDCTGAQHHLDRPARQFLARISGGVTGIAGILPAS